MGAVLLWLGSELRRTWRSWVVLALLIGVFSGIAIGAFAGARRTETAYPRFVEEQDGFFALVGGGPSRAFEERREALLALPQIEDRVEIIMVGFGMQLPAVRDRVAQRLTFPTAIIGADPSGRTLYEINRAKVLEGRLAERSDPDEVTVPFTVAERFDVRVGDRVDVEIGFEGEDLVQLEVVGITAAPWDFEAVGQQTLSFVFVTPARYELLREQLGPLNVDTWNLAVRLRNGAADLPSFREAVSGELGFDVPTVEPIVSAGVQKSMRLYGAALWILGALIALATIAIGGQTMARRQQLAARDDPTLRALGFSGRGLASVRLARATMVAAPAALIAAGTAYALSAFLPIGVPRIAEPDPGLHADLFVLGVGAAAVFAVSLLLAIPSALRARRPLRTEAAAVLVAGRPSRIATLAARSIDTPSAAVGLRMAFESGRGATAVPVRSTILAVTAGIAAITLIFVAGSSLAYLARTPALAGFTYDAIVPSETANGDDDERLRALEAVNGIEAAAAGTALNVSIDGVDSFLVAYEREHDVGFATIAGEAPTDRMHSLADGSSVPEIVLGPATMRRAGLQIGDIIRFEYEGEDASGTQRARIVGAAAIPALPWAIVDPGEGAAMTLGAVRTFVPDEGGCCFVRFEPGADPAVVSRAIQDSGLGMSFLRGSRADLATLERMSGLPSLLGAVFALMATGALAHVLVSAVRRRRRDLAILKTLGFVRGQVASTIAFQATAIAVVCLAIGIPLGIALGRSGWRLIADGFGVVPVVRIPVAPLALTAVTCLVLANLIAALPARAAARTRPAIVLRAE